LSKPQRLIDWICSGIAVAFHGLYTTDKIKIVLVLILECLRQVFIYTKMPYVHSKLINIEEKMVRNTVVFINSIYYVLTDINSVFIVSHNFERWIWKYFKIKEKGAFIDIGANIGKYSLKIAKVFEHNKVVAIEPGLESYQSLLKSIELNNIKNVIALNIAAWNKNSIMKLFITPTSDFYTLIKDYGLGYIEVVARPVDDVLDELNISDVSCIKIDAEGAEVNILMGLKNTLKTKSPRVIVECSSEMNLKSLKKLAKQINYKVIPIKESSEYFLLVPSTCSKV